MDEKRLVEHHVLYEQNSVIEKLLQSDECLIDNICNLDDNEVLEWWLVTEWLAEQLKEQGEVIIDDYGCYWWGRQTSGQAIYMDAVIAEICSSFD
ncbi:hypothetical protein LJC45_03150 [Alistipes sp. OttesenSCG-928-B03]|nr:hypothetical protein [Alistipes sp. OttesenSCG-928-B03]